MCFNARLSIRPTRSFPHCVRKPVLSVFVCTAALRISTSFQIPCICVNIQYLFFSFWLTSLCITGIAFFFKIFFDGYHFFKSLLNGLQCCFFYVLVFWLWDPWDLGSLTRHWTCVSCIGRQVLTRGPWGTSPAFLFLHLILLAFPQTNECASVAWFWTSACSHVAVPYFTWPNAVVQEGYSQLCCVACNYCPSQHALEARCYSRSMRFQLRRF